MASNGEALSGLWFSGQKYFGDTLSAIQKKEIVPALSETRRWLDIYFSGIEPDFTPRIHMQASPFRMSVWEILLGIPYGHTMTYGEIASEIARRNGFQRMSAQAVGGAVGHNPISLVVPCHRVIGADGNITGYAGGIEKKIALLELEHIDTTGIFIPGK